MPQGFPGFLKSVLTILDVGLFYRESKILKVQLKRSFFGSKSLKSTFESDAAEKGISSSKSVALLKSSLAKAFWLLKQPMEGTQAAQGRQEGHHGMSGVFRQGMHIVQSSHFAISKHFPVRQEAQPIQGMQ